MRRDTGGRFSCVSPKKADPFFDTGEPSPCVSPAGLLITQDLTLPNFSVNAILYLPPTVSEVNFNILIDTRSTLLSLDNLNALISVGIILVISVVAQVQLLVPAFGFCDDVCDCEDYIPSEATTCIDFLDETKTVFPLDFYPPQVSDC